MYPYQSHHFEKDFNLTRYQVGCVINRINIKNNPKYHDSIKTGKKSFTNKYSEKLHDKIKNILERYPKFVNEAFIEYQIDLKQKRYINRQKL